MCNNVVVAEFLHHQMGNVCVRRSCMLHCTKWTLRENPMQYQNAIRSIRSRTCYKVLWHYVCTLVHSIFMNIVGTLHFFSAGVCIYWSFCLPLCVSDICGIWSDSIKSPCQARDWMRNVKWNSGNLFEFDAYQLHMPTCLLACMVLFLFHYMQFIWRNSSNQTSKSIKIDFHLIVIEKLPRDWLLLTCTPISIPIFHTPSADYCLASGQFDGFESELMCEITILLHSKTWFSLIMSAHSTSNIKFWYVISIKANFQSHMAHALQIR